MLTLSNSRKADKDLFNSYAEAYIPIACHYDENTLLTKNGQMLQIIQINGINAEQISSKLFNLREVVRQAIQKNVNSNQLAFWVHTIRHKTNLDDMTPYKKLFPANLHELWRQKNYWSDKFVNTLYISIVYDTRDIKMNNLTSFVHSLFASHVENSHQEYFDESSKYLNTVVDKILEDLSEYGATKLGIKFKEDEVLSELLALYHKLIHLNTSEPLLPLADLSDSLASCEYAIGGDKIEVVSGESKNFIAILSIKEYQEVSTESVDIFLQIPVEMVVTEVFYFVDEETIASSFSDQAYIIEVSGDKSLGVAKGYNKILGNDLSQTESYNQFCTQQISISIISEDVDKLDKEVAYASRKLSEIGIVHVREDINLEQTFWAQLPANFSYLRRMTPNIINNVAALASLHNFPTGYQNSQWGRAITILRSERGTPYFMNFHAGSESGNSLIFGIEGVGKTAVTNFLISESTKYDPTIVYIANDNTSQIFIEALEGHWVKEPQTTYNPFLCDDTKENRQFASEFLKIICNHYAEELTAPELEYLEELTKTIFAIDFKDRTLSKIIKSNDFTGAAGEAIKARLVVFAESGLYHGLFDGNSSFDLSPSKVLGVNLSNFSNEDFIKQFYPEDKKLLDKFTKQLNLNNSVKFAIIYVLARQLSILDQKPKILAIDNIDKLLDQNYFAEPITAIFKSLSSHNGVVVGNINLTNFQEQELKICQSWSRLGDTKIIMPAEVKLEKLEKTLGLTKAEIAKFTELKPLSRSFLVKQGEQAIVAELSIGGFTGMLSILVSDADTFKIYQEILKQYPGHPDNWIVPLHKALEK